MRNRVCAKKKLYNSTLQRHVCLRTGLDCFHEYWRSPRPPRAVSSGRLRAKVVAFAATGNEVFGLSRGGSGAAEGALLREDTMLVCRGFLNARGQSPLDLCLDDWLFHSGHAGAHHPDHGLELSSCCGSRC